MNTVIFTVECSNREVGFTKKDLVDKVMKYFNLMKQVNNNFNIDSGQYDIGNGSKIFHGVRDYDYEIGVVNLEYHKDINTWEVCFDYYI